jgi:hypothetical protein
MLMLRVDGTGLYMVNSVDEMGTLGQGLKTASTVADAGSVGNTAVPPSPSPFITGFSLLTTDLAQGSRQFGGYSYINLPQRGGLLGLNHTPLTHNFSPDRLVTPIIPAQRLQMRQEGDRLGLRQALPQRQQVPVEVDPSLPPKTVRVHYSVNPETQEVTGVYLRTGPGATPADVQLHSVTVGRMQQYSGMNRNVRLLQDRMGAWVQQHGNPPVGSKAWEARLEIDKLPGLMRQRMNQLQDAGLDPKTQQTLQAELDSLKQQFVQAQRNLQAMSVNPGVGFVAAESTAAGRLRAGELQAPQAADGYYYALNQNGDLEYKRNPGRNDLPPMHYDSDTNQIVQGASRNRPVERFAGDVNANTAYQRLMQQPSLSAYATMLQRAGIIQTPEQLQTVLASNITIAGRSVDEVRHNLKAYYRQQVMDHLTNPNLNQAQQHQELLRLTSVLRGEDKGPLHEAWFRQTELQGQGMTQVPAGKNRLQAQGIEGLVGDRKIDILNGSTLYEIKSVRGALQGDDIAQFEDFMRLMRGRGQVSQGGQNYPVDRAQYVFTDPQGVRANARWMGDQLDDRENTRLSFRIFNNWSLD